MLFQVGTYCGFYYWIENDLAENSHGQLADSIAHASVHYEH